MEPFPIHNKPLWGMEKSQERNWKKGKGEALIKGMPMAVVPFEGFLRMNLV